MDRRDMLTRLMSVAGGLLGCLGFKPASKYVQDTAVAGAEVATGNEYGLVSVGAPWRNLVRFENGHLAFVENGHVTCAKEADWGSAWGSKGWSTINPAEIEASLQESHDRGLMVGMTDLKPYDDKLKADAELLKGTMAPVAIDLLVGGRKMVRYRHPCAVPSGSVLTKLKVSAEFASPEGEDWYTDDQVVFDAVLNGCPIEVPEAPLDPRVVDYLANKVQFETWKNGAHSGTT